MQSPVLSMAELLQAAAGVVSMVVYTRVQPEMFRAAAPQVLVVLVLAGAEEEVGRTCLWSVKAASNTMKPQAAASAGLLPPFSNQRQRPRPILSRRDATPCCP